MKRVIVPALAIAMIVSSWPVSAAGGPAGRPAGVAAATGTIVGTAMSSNGQMLSDFTAHVRSLQSGALVGSATSNAAGRFSFAGLNPGRYVVEVASQSGPILGISSALDVTAGATVAVTVNAAVAVGGAAQAGGGTTQSHGVRTAVIITTIAAAAGIVAAVAIATNDSSPSR